MHDVEKKVVRSEILQKGFANVKMGTRDGAAIVQATAASLEDLLKGRAEAAENIMRKAEKLFAERTHPDTNYIFDKSLVSNYVFYIFLLRYIRPAIRNHDVPFLIWWLIRNILMRSL